MKPNQIKFRAKTIDTNQWVYGYYIRFETRQICPTNDELADDEVIHLIANESFADWNMPRQMNFTKVVEKSVGQFTGRFSKNKKEIYEGDIVEYKDSLGQGIGCIEWDIKDCCYGINDDKANYDLPLGRFLNCELVVIGNVFDKEN